MTPYRILYIEDEHILGKLVKDALEAAGYEVMMVTNGSEAMRTYKKYQPHICLLDVMLPGMDGYTIARQIRENDLWLPIIYLTAKVQSQDVVTGFETGANDYIRKPFSMDELLLRIKNWINERYPTAKAPVTESIVMDNCIFAPLSGKLQCADGKTIQLTHKEAELLLLLHTSNKNILSRDYILQKIWGSHTVSNSRSLDVYITRLRGYLKGSSIEIITLKGIGYRFVGGS